MKKKLFILLLLVVNFFLFSCRKETEEPVSYYYEYFPLKLHSSFTYSVDSIVFDDFSGTSDTFHYQVKDSVENVFTDNAGRLSYEVIRYYRPEDSTGWTFMQQDVLNRDDIRAERKENNHRYIKLVFPVSEGKTWNGNLYNSKGEKEYIYADVHKPAISGSLSFDSTLRVIQADETNLIREIYAEERYAAYTGLIYKKIKDVHKDIGTGKITKGLIYTQQLIATQP